MNKLRLIGLVGLLALVLAACGGAGEQGASAPTAAPQPTATPAPTATPEPTATPAPSADASEAIPAALEKASKVTSYRLDLVMNIKGALDQRMPDIDPEKDIEAISISGEVDGADTHFTMKGFFAAVLGVEPDVGFEVISVDGKSYLRGPIPTLGALEDKWYVVEGPQSAISQPPVTPGDLFKGFDKEGKALAALKNTGRETIHDQQCDIYSSDKETTLDLLQGADNSLPFADSMGEIQDASTRIAVCEDGYVHEMQFKISGTAKDKPTQQASFAMTMHMSDFDSDIAISAPADALELGEPQLMKPTPQP